MKLQDKINHYIKDNPDNFYVDNNNFILNLTTGELVLINPIDGRLVKPASEERVKEIHQDILDLIHINAIPSESLQMFLKFYNI